MPIIRKLDTQADDFHDQLEALLRWESVANESVTSTVHAILLDIQRRGDEAVLEYTRRFDRLDCQAVDQLEIPEGKLRSALSALPQAQREALTYSADRLRRYAEKQSLESWSYTEPDGTVLGQQVSALDRVGLYVPGGKAAYPSSVLMNAIPAKVAGVPELVMVVPAPGGELNELVLAAAAVAGVDRVFTVGGAQAIGALAYGTQTIPAVDKIVGPGNIYVAAAKREVYGTVGIDMIAGPSEILVICDGQTNPSWIAADLFSQAEHDEDAQAIFICPDEQFIRRVEAAMDTLLDEMPRADIIRTSLEARGAMIVVRDLDEAVDLANFIAPEHLELSVADPDSLAERIHHAGAMFLGRYTAEALGDYCAGPNHVLPTSRTARFSSPLGVYDFQKRTSIIHCSQQGAHELGRTAVIMAEGEGLMAHAQSARYRTGQE